MKLTKEDYMRLPKERLAELLVEMQNELPSFIPIPTYQPVVGVEEPWRPPYRFTACNDQVKAE